MKKRRLSAAAVLAICAVGATGPVSVAAGATAGTANTIRIHCGHYLFAHSIKITGPYNEAHSGWNCETAHHMIKEGKLSDDSREFSSPGWNCSRAPTRFRPYTFYCSKHRVLVEFDV